MVWAANEEEKLPENDGWLCVDLIIFASVHPEFLCNQFIPRYWSHEKCILNESFLLLKMAGGRCGKVIVEQQESERASEQENKWRAAEKK